jgi:hypothetical protein
MGSIIKSILAGSAAVLLWGGTSFPASAYYLGYGNGDPQNWGFYEEQHNGASPPPSAGGPPPIIPHVAPVHHGHIVYQGHRYKERHG